MGDEIGRNDPCWCGSGLKFKRCHYRRDKQKPVAMHDLIRTVKKVFNREECLHPDAPSSCKGSIIKAHTIQKNGGLSRIAKKGHVYNQWCKLNFCDAFCVGARYIAPNKDILAR